MFDNFDLKKSGFLTLGELAAMVKKLKIVINERWLSNVFAKLDFDNSGYIEYEEFLIFI